VLKKVLFSGIAAMGLLVGSTQTSFANDTITKADIVDENGNVSENKVFKLLFETKYKDANPEITDIKVPLKLELTDISTDCSSLQLMIKGAAMCPPAFQARIIEVSDENSWDVSVWGHRDKSSFGDSFPYAKIKEYQPLSEDNLDLIDEKLSQVEWDFKYSVGGDEAVRKLLLKNRKIAEKGKTITVHATLWFNVKKDYVQYERSPYKSLEPFYVNDGKREAGKPHADFAGENQSSKFDMIHNQ
jgi:hypothetical protein